MAPTKLFGFFIMGVVSVVSGVAGVQQTVSTFAETGHYSQPRREFGDAESMVDISNLPESSVQTKPLPAPYRTGPSSAVDSIEFPGPSGSTGLTSSEKCHPRTPMSRCKTSEYLLKKGETHCARKARQVQNEVRRLRQKLRTYKLHIKQRKNKSANREF